MLNNKYSHSGSVKTFNVFLLKPQDCECKPKSTQLWQGVDSTDQQSVKSKINSYTFLLFKLEIQKILSLLWEQRGHKNT